MSDLHFRALEVPVTPTPNDDEQCAVALPPIPIRRTSPTMWAMRVIGGLTLLALAIAAWRLLDVPQPQLKAATTVQAEAPAPSAVPHN